MGLFIENCDKLIEYNLVELAKIAFGPVFVGDFEKYHEKLKSINLDHVLLMDQIAMYSDLQPLVG